MMINHLPFCLNAVLFLVAFYCESSEMIDIKIPICTFLTFNGIVFLLSFLTDCCY